MAGPVATVVLRATWEPALEELQAATTAALASLTAALATPVALPGGGATETLLAEHVRREAVAECSTRYQRWPVEHRLVIPPSASPYPLPTQGVAAPLHHSNAHA